MNSFAKCEVLITLAYFSQTNFKNNPFLHKKSISYKQLKSALLADLEIGMWLRRQFQPEKGRLL